MAQNSTQTIDDQLLIPTLDELDRLAGIDRLAELDPKSRLVARIAAHQVLAAQREAVVQQEVE